MYKLLLISKYLRRKLAPLFAALAVTICTAMVIIVGSVMGGFLGLMQTTAKQLTPDVVIRTPSLTGFDGYEKLIAILEARPEVELATPAVVSPASVTFGDLNYPVTSEVIVHGIDPVAYNRIVPYEKTLMWSAQDMDREYLLSRRGIDPGDADIHAAGATLSLPKIYQNESLPNPQPGATIGVALNPLQWRQKDGSYLFENAFIGGTISLAMPVFGPRGQPLDVSQPSLRVVNEFKSGFYDADSKVVFVPFDWLQKRLQMNLMEEFTEFDPQTGLGGETVVRQARCTHIYVKAAANVPIEKLHAVCMEIAGDFRMKNPGTPLNVLTWEEVHGQLLGAVKNERGLVTFLFAIISVVAIVMVATTFYMIVLEKTRDIGVLRAIGAPAMGVLSLFLSYGLAIGLIGAGLGVWLAWFTVTHLNNLQDALANRLATLIATVVISTVLALVAAIGMSILKRKRDFSLGAGVMVFLGVFAVLMAITFYSFPQISLPGISIDQIVRNGRLVDNPESHALDARIGWRMWDPQLYFFEKIPDQVDWLEVLYVWIGAVLSSVVGAIIPAIIAARLNPIEALRYE